MVATGESMLPPLRRIKRRVRAFAGLEGGIAGGAATALALAVAAVIARFAARAADGGGGSWCRWPWAVFGAIAAGCALGALGRAVRSVSLVFCARLADRALDGEDRILSALSIDEGASPLAAALRADAVERLARLTPRQAFAGRRPPGLAALGLAALTLVATTSLPLPSPGPRTPLAPAAARPLPPHALDQARRQARAAGAEAERLSDQSLGRVAAAFAEALGGLASGALQGGAALERLRDLEAQAAAGAGAAERDRRAFRAALAALDARAATRVAARSLDTGDADSAARQLADSARASPRQTGASLAAAAADLEDALDRPKAPAGNDAAASEPGARRLAQDQRWAGSEPGAQEIREAPGPRRLEALRRDLERDATSCRNGDAACQASAADRARDLAAVGRRAAAADSWRRLERAAGDLGSRAGRGELAEGDSPSARAFEQAARGRPPDLGANPGDDPADAERGPRPGSPAIPNASAAAADRAASNASEPLGRAGSPNAARATIALAGDGIGRQAGGEPLGVGGGPDPARGSDTRVRLADGRGPNRASTIEGAARAGFAGPGYARVFTDYAGAVEDALGTSAVPDEKRHLVRRYFELIRPRGSMPTGDDRP